MKRLTIFEPGIYHASQAALLELIRGLPDTVRAPLLVGHNPHLQEVILELTSQGHERHRVGEKFPTAGLAVIAVATEH